MLCCAQPVSATPGPAHQIQASIPLRSLLPWHFVPKVWMQMPVSDQPGLVTGQLEGEAQPLHPPGPAQLTTAPSPVLAGEFPRPRPLGHASQSHAQLPAPQLLFWSPTVHLLGALGWKSGTGELRGSPSVREKELTTVNYETKSRIAQMLLYKRSLVISACPSSLFLFVSLSLSLPLSQVAQAALRLAV